MLEFTKMNGAGNDFVLLDNREGTLSLDAAAIALLCDRHRGIGADGVLIVEPPKNGADFRMRYYNADGGEAEMCGNGARCFARFVSRIAGPRERIRFETEAGVIEANLAGGLIRLQMGPPKDLTLNIDLPLESGNRTVHSVNTGVPHAVTVVDDLEKTDVSGLGPAIRHHKRFAPKGTNANFIQPLGPQSVAIRTYERGVEGETLACGTGVVAAALIYHHLTGAPSPVSVRVQGGDLLEVGFATAGGQWEVTLTGPAEFVFDGQIDL